MASQTKRLIIAKMNGFNATLEKVSQASIKRGNNPFIVVKGDGTSKAEYVHDPVLTFPEVTLSVAVAKNDAFVANARMLALQHKQDPSTATNVDIKSFDDSGAVVNQISLVKAVIQEVKMPDGDTGSHTEAMAEIIVQPADVITSSST